MSFGGRMIRRLSNRPWARDALLYEFWRQILPDPRRTPIDHPEIFDFLGFAARRRALANSKTGQDLWVAYEAGEKRNGFFVEFGAENGLRGSNSLALEREYGWRGILAEPNPLWAETFKQNRPLALHSTDCVWVRSGDTIEFAATDNPGLSTIKSYVTATNHRSQRARHKEVRVPTISLSDLLTQFNAPSALDYISMDTEGSELEILKAFDFDRWEVNLFTIEHNGPEQEARIAQLMTSRGYERRFPTLSMGDSWYRRRR